MTIVETHPITGGVDTHLDIHVAAALDSNGGTLGVESFPTTTGGFSDLYAWLSGFGTLGRGRGGRHRRLWGRPGPLLAHDRGRGDRG